MPRYRAVVSWRESASVEITADSPDNALEEANHIGVPDESDYAGGFSAEWVERIDEPPEGYLDIMEDV